LNVERNKMEPHLALCRTFGARDRRDGYAQSAYQRHMPNGRLNLMMDTLDRQLLIDRLLACETHAKLVRDTTMALRSLASDDRFALDPEILVVLMNESNATWTEIQALRMALTLERRCDYERWFSGEEKPRKCCTLLRGHDGAHRFAPEEAVPQVAELRMALTMENEPFDWCPYSGPGTAIRCALPEGHSGPHDINPDGITRMESMPCAGWYFGKGKPRKRCTLPRGHDGPHGLTIEKEEP
jgi:hypothetical protein